MLSLRARESSRRRGRDRKADRKPDLKPHLKVESLEPRLALATGLLSTLVSVVRDDASHSLLAPGTTTKITEGEQLTASVRLTRKPDSAILVSFKNPAALEVGAPLTTLRFTRATWNQPQTVSFASLQDGSRDGDHVVPVKMKTAVARNPQSKATKTVRIESLDSGVVTPDSPVTATQKGSIFGGGNTGSVVGTYDAGKNLGTATFKVTMPGVKHVRNRTITVDYSVNPDSTVKVERLEGIPREKFRLDATHRRVGVDHGLFGTLTVMQPKLGQSATAMMTANAGVGIVTDGTPFSGGGFDGDGYAYSWQALGSSSTLAWNGVTFDLGSPNEPNMIHAAGQTIAVPQGSYNVLSIAGAAANGPQINQHIKLTFTDNSTMVVVQSFSDWGNPQNYPHESIISTQSYRDTASGGTNQFTNHVYGYSYTLSTKKTLQSITLPTNANLGFLDFQMSNATSVDLSTQYTRWGIANGNTNIYTKNAGFDGHGQYYYSGELKPTITWSGATFAFGPVPTTTNPILPVNFVQAKGQSINLPQGDYRWLYLAGAAANGSQQNQQFTLTFSDGSTATWTQSFSDWCNPSNFSGESITQMQPDWVKPGGVGIGGTPGVTKQKTNYVYGYAYQIPAGKTLVSITLPNNENNLGILGISML